MPEPRLFRRRIELAHPYDGAAMLAFLAARAIPGVESVGENSYARTLRLPIGVGTIRLTLPRADGGDARAVLALEDPGDLPAALELCRRLLDADAEPRRTAAVLGSDPALAPSVGAHPGLRVPGCVDGAEILVRAIAGQQISVAAARHALHRWTVAADERLPWSDTELTHLFPSPAAFAALDPASIAGPRRRALTLTATMSAVATGELDLGPHRDTADLTADLVRHRGIGPWTAGYMALRVLADPDVLMVGDLALRRGAAALGLPAEPRELARHAERWRPCRSYAGMHLWQAAARSGDR